MDFLVFLLSCYGVVNIVTTGKIFEATRKMLARMPGRIGYWAGYWIKCPMCMGLPVGMAWSLIGLKTGIHSGSITGVAAAGAVSSGWCWVMRVILSRLGEDEL